jgi:hypothetical protein
MWALHYIEYLGANLKKVESERSGKARQQALAVSAILAWVSRLLLQEEPKASSHYAWPEHLKPIKRQWAKLAQSEAALIRLAVAD